jgi:hypothetical protein
MSVITLSQSATLAAAHALKSTGIAELMRVASFKEEEIQTQLEEIIKRETEKTELVVKQAEITAAQQEQVHNFTSKYKTFIGDITVKDRPIQSHEFPRTEQMLCDLGNLYSQNIRSPELPSAHTLLVIGANANAGFTEMAKTAKEPEKEEAALRIKFKHADTLSRCSRECMLHFRVNDVHDIKPEDLEAAIKRNLVKDPAEELAKQSSSSPTTQLPAPAKTQETQLAP